MPDTAGPVDVRSGALAAALLGALMMVAWAVGPGAYLGLHAAPVVGAEVAGPFYRAMVIGGLVLAGTGVWRGSGTASPYLIGIGALMVATVALWPSGLAVALPFAAMALGGLMGLRFTGDPRPRSPT